MRVALAISGLLLSSIAPGAQAQEKRYIEAELCDSIGAPEMAARLGGQPVGSRYTDFDSNTQVAWCKRNFIVAGQVFFVQGTFFLNSRERGAAMRPRSVEIQGRDVEHKWLFVDALDGKRGLAVIAGYEEVAQQVDERLTRSVLELTRDYLERWPPD